MFPSIESRTGTVRHQLCRHGTTRDHSLAGMSRTLPQSGRQCTHCSQPRCILRSMNSCRHRQFHRRSFPTRMSTTGSSRRSSRPGTGRRSAHLCTRSCTYSRHCHRGRPHTSLTTNSCTERSLAQRSLTHTAGKCHRPGTAHTCMRLIPPSHHRRFRTVRSRGNWHRTGRHIQPSTRRRTCLQQQYTQVRGYKQTPAGTNRTKPKHTTNEYWPYPTGNTEHTCPTHVAQAGANTVLPIVAE
jgi:hypothetical protein